jgi:hypothetical protein
MRMDDHITHIEPPEPSQAPGESDYLYIDAPFGGALEELDAVRGRLRSACAGSGVRRARHRRHRR